MFAPRLSPDYAVWLGEIKPLAYFKVIILPNFTSLPKFTSILDFYCYFQERYMVSKVFYVDEIVQVLTAQYGESEKPLLFLLYGLNTDSNNFSKPAVLEVCVRLALKTCLFSKGHIKLRMIGQPDHI